MKETAESRTQVTVYEHISPKYIVEKLLVQADLER